MTPFRYFASPVAAFLFSGAAFAGLFKDTVHYEVRVVDEQTRPIPWATLWVMGPTLGRTDLKPEDLARLVRRYAADADFVNSTNLHDQLWVMQTDGAGKARFAQEDTEVRGFKRVQISVAGLKRGFLPTQVDDDAPDNSRRKILLRLRADAAAKGDERMETLDRIRALSDPESETDDPVGGDRKSRLVRYDTQLRALAAELEKDGRADDAAAIYYNLAWLPAVDYAREESGEWVVTGYTNGFDDRNPRRVADRKRAWQLQRGHPALEYEALLASYEARGLRVLAYAKDAPVREAYIAETEALIRKYGERLWPAAYWRLSDVYMANNDFAAACRALQARYAFEPSILDAEGWTGSLASYEAGIKNRGGAANTRCELPAVPLPIPIP